MPRPTGPKGAKSATLTVRLTPRTNFGLTLLTRVTHRSMGEIVETALEGLFYGEGPGTLERRVSGSTDRVALIDETWDERPWVRLGKLALLAPELLSDLETALWEHITQSPKYWKKGKAVEDFEAFPERMEHASLQEDWDKLSRECRVKI